MKTFTIIDSYRGEHIMDIQARNKKSALKKFMPTLTSTGFAELHRISDTEWELSTTYGKYYRAIERM